MPRPKRTPTPPRQLHVTLLAFAVIILTFAGLAPAQADDPTSQSDWGSQGFIGTTESAITVHWDNSAADTAAEVPIDDQVTRDETQTLAHSGGTKTYQDVNQNVRDAYQAAFGPGNGVVGSDGTPGLQMTVSQTTNLLYQSVGVTFSGAPGTLDLPGASQPFQTQVALMQCWGAADETAPDPSHCEYGFSDSTRVLPVDASDQALIAPDDPAAGQLLFPKASIAGGDPTTQVSTTSSNEQTVILSRPTIFQINTGAESSFLGCGARADDTPSTDTCWLVAVPLNAGINQSSHAFSSPNGIAALSPSLWAQRLQVKLSMAPVFVGCANGQARTLGAGSELLPDAMRSWIPGLCDSQSISFGFTPIGDDQARQQYGAGGQKLIFTTQPVPDAPGTVFVPVALSGLVVSYTVDKFQAEQVTSLKLTPLLVAKLLTESYLSGIERDNGSQLSTKAGWANLEIQNLQSDPLFQALNPDLAGVSLGNSNLGDLVGSNLRSDAVQQLWPWLLNDPAAKAFLDGCPDPNGSVINPFFSTRTYAECQSDATTLETAAARKRDHTQTPATYIDEPMIYPPDGTVIPQPDWYERDAIVDGGGNVQQLPLTLTDLHAHTNALVDAGIAVANATYPANTSWCPVQDGCINGDAPGMWKSSAFRASPGSRAVMGLTDSATAALFQTPTALLCDDSGQHCVGADSDSLQAAVAGLAPSGTDGVLVPPDVPDYAGGGYPLMMPVYAAVKTDGLADVDRTAIADALEYMTTDAQIPGINPGELPPGYAPLTSALADQAAAAIDAIRTPAPAAPAVDNNSKPAVPVTRTVPVSNNVHPNVPAPPVAPQQPKASTALSASATPATETGFPQWGLFGGLGGALASVGIAPILGRKRRGGGW